MIVDRSIPLIAPINLDASPEKRNLQRRLNLGIHLSRCLCQEHELPSSYASRAGRFLIGMIFAFALGPVAPAKSGCKALPITLNLLAVVQYTVANAPCDSDSCARDVR